MARVLDDIKDFLATKCHNIITIVQENVRLKYTGITWDLLFRKSCDGRPKTYDICLPEAFLFVYSVRTF